MVKLSKRALRKKANKKTRSQERQRFGRFSSLLNDLKGKRFEASFKCDMCGHTRYVGYEFTVDDDVYEICKFCHDSLFDKRPSVKVIYTPMGNGR